MAVRRRKRWLCRILILRLACCTNGALILQLGCVFHLVIDCTEASDFIFSTEKKGLAIRRLLHSA
jgi:hypothetical protein